MRYRSHTGRERETTDQHDAKCLGQLRIERVRGREGGVREKGREGRREREREKRIEEFLQITESAKEQNNSLFAADVFCASLREEMSTVTDFSTSDTSFILLLGRGQLPDSLSSSAYLSSTSSQRFSRAFRASWDVLSEAKYYIKRKRSNDIVHVCMSYTSYKMWRVQITELKGEIITLI